MRERKEKEKQTEQDREISTTQWCVEAMKAEMEVKEGVFQRVSTAWLTAISQHKPGQAVSLPAAG